MRQLISFVSVLRTLLGIPCAFVRNWVLALITAWAIVFFPCLVGWVAFHFSSSDLILSMIGSHSFSSFVLCPIHAPRDLIALPSLAICISGFIGLLLRFQVGPLCEVHVVSSKVQKGLRKRQSQNHFRSQGSLRTVTRFQVGSSGLSGIHAKASSIDNYDLDCVNKTET
jgi:hypothetical protein